MAKFLYSIALSAHTLSSSIHGYTLTIIADGEKNNHFVCTKIQHQSTLHPLLPQEHYPIQLSNNSTILIELSWYTKQHTPVTESWAITLQNPTHVHQQQFGLSIDELINASTNMRAALKRHTTHQKNRAWLYTKPINLFFMPLPCITHACFLHHHP